MKQIRILAAFAIAVFAVSGVSAQSLKGMGLNGATGLIAVPSGRIGWEQSSNFGLDFGYHTLIDDSAMTHIPKFSMSIFKWVEVSGAFDIQPEYNTPVNSRKSNADFIGGLKVQLPIQSTALALGGNLQVLDMGNDNGHVGGQVYVAVTYAGDFFDMPAETTVVLGKSFGKYVNNWNIDFGMGFDLVLLPNVFNRFVHWVTDFSNFSYSLNPIAVSTNRGILNTGFRIDLAAIPALSRFKFALDIMMTDLLDEDRAFAVGLVFGVPIL